MADPLVPTASTIEPTEAPPAAAADEPAAEQSASDGGEQTAGANGDGETNRLSLSQDALNERLGQAKRSAVNSFLKDMGFEKPEDLQEWKKAANAAIEAERERARAKMTEVDRYKEDLEAERAARQADREAREAAEKQAESLRVQNHLHGLFMNKGIKNTQYALFRVEQALSQLEDGQDLDEVAFIDQLCQDDMEKAALGLGQIMPDRRPAETTQQRTGPDPVPQAGDDDFDAMSASPEQLEKRLRQLGFHG